MLRALKPERRPYRAWLAGHPDRKAIFERLEWKAWSTLLWGLDAGDPKAIRFYLDTFRRLPDGSVRARALPRLQPLAVKPIRPPTVAKLQAQDRRRARESARVFAAEAIVADVHARGAETYAALAADLPAWRLPPTWKHGSRRSHRSYRSHRSDGAPRLRGEKAPGRQSPLEHLGRRDLRARRRRLRDKALCFGLAGSERFGRDFFATVQARHNVVEAHRGVFLSDGAVALRNIQREHFPRHVRQLDWAHVRRRLDEAYGPARRARSAQLLGKLYLGERELVCREIRREAWRYRSRSEILDELAGYLEGPGQDLYGSRRLRQLGAELPPHLNGSGGIERNIAVLVGQRMKRRGMSWTRRGTANLLAVRQDLLAHLHAS